MFFFLEFPSNDNKINRTEPHVPLANANATGGDSGNNIVSIYLFILLCFWRLSIYQFIEIVCDGILNK